MLRLALSYSLCCAQVRFDLRPPGGATPDRAPCPPPRASRTPDTQRPVLPSPARTPNTEHRTSPQPPIAETRFGPPFPRLRSALSVLGAANGRSKPRLLPKHESCRAQALPRSPLPRFTAIGVSSHPCRTRVASQRTAWTSG